MKVRFFFLPHFLRNRIVNFRWMQREGRDKQKVRKDLSVIFLV